MSIIHATRLDFDNAMAAGKRSIELAPNVATNHGVLALIHYYCGNHAQSLMWTRKAIRLSPYFPDWFLIPLGEGYRGTGALDKARDVFEHFAVRTPDSLLPQTILVHRSRQMIHRALEQPVVLYSESGFHCDGSD